jgi:hypothetical protein
MSYGSDTAAKGQLIAAAPAAAAAVEEEAKLSPL